MLYYIFLFLFANLLDIYFELLLFIYKDYFTPCDFFTSVLADGLSLESEWQQVSLSLRDSSQYSGQS